MAKRILFRRGAKANISAITLNEGEPAFTLDENYLYIGTAGGKVVFVCLNANGKLPIEVIPHQAITDVFVKASEAEMLGLSTAAVGDVCIRTDVNQNYILQTAPASVLSNWVLLSVSDAGVNSIGGKTGNVTLASLGLDDTSLGSKIRAALLTGLTTVTAAAITAADSVLSAFAKLQAQIILKADLASPALTGTPTAPTAPDGTRSTQIATTEFVMDAIDVIDGGTF
jgi:hypothetical protein